MSSKHAKTALLAGGIVYILILMTQCKTKDDLERAYFRELVENIHHTQTISDEDSDLLAALHLTHRLLAERQIIFHDQHFSSFQPYDGSLTGDILTASGCCGSYAAVLCELLQCMGYKARIAQMQVGGQPGGHIVTEVKTIKGWVVLDALYDQHFRTPGNQLASFREVADHWSYYQKQVKKEYNLTYNYAGVRYTNWDKFPILLPLMKKALVLVLGREKAEQFSVRPYFLRKFLTQYRLFMAALCLLLLVLTLRLKLHLYALKYFFAQRNVFLQFRWIGRLERSRFEFKDTVGEAVDAQLTPMPA